MSDKSNMGVYDLKQAERIKGKFNKKVSSVENTAKVSEDYAERYNENFKETGSYYEINKEGNEKYLKMVKEKLDKIDEED